MNTAIPSSPPSPEKILRRLFLTLFLRGRTARGLKKETAPKSVGQKLALTLLFYALFGGLALLFVGQPVFALAVYLHAMTFAFLGLFVASSAGEVLFNDLEADILLHRPITPRALLEAKVRVLVEISIWIAGAFNLCGLVAGILARDGHWQFPIVHAISTSLLALFTTGCVVMVYQLCLRWFGRERLNSLMTTTQVLVSIAAVLSGQILPQLVLHAHHVVTLSEKTWWLILFPPAWFAGFDDAMAGSMKPGSWVLAALAMAAPLIVLSIAIGKLARDYGTGLQRLAEIPAGPQRRRRRWLDRLTRLPPMRWWLRDPVARASFLLCGAYLARDRDVKLRIYPAMAPILIMPLIFVSQGFMRDQNSGMAEIFGIVMTSCYLGLVPWMALDLLQYSQQWQASDLFRAVPIVGPAPLFHGARRAVLCLLTFPLLALVAVLVGVFDHDRSHLLLLIPGAIVLPIYALAPGLGGKAVPLSLPTEEAKSTGRAMAMIVGIIISMGVAGLTVWAWMTGWFCWLIAAELIVAVSVYTIMHRSLNRVRWQSVE